MHQVGKRSRYSILLICNSSLKELCKFSAFCQVHTYCICDEVGKTNHVRATNEMHFVAPYYRYIHTLSKHSDKIIKGGQVCFSTRLFLGHSKYWKASTDSEGHFNRMAWTQIVSYTLALSSVVVACLAYGLS